VPKVSVTAGHTGRAATGTANRRRPAAPAGLPPERARHQPTPRARPAPPAHSLAEVLALVVFPPRLTHSLFGTWCLLLSIPARAEARRWRAEGAPLKPFVKKVVTSQRTRSASLVSSRARVSATPMRTRTIPAAISTVKDSFSTMTPKMMATTGSR
jgi:hypothetical protein